MSGWGGLASNTRLGSLQQESGWASPSDRTLGLSFHLLLPLNVPWNLLGIRTGPTAKPYVFCRSLVQQHTDQNKALLGRVASKALSRVGSGKNLRFATRANAGAPGWEPALGLWGFA